MTTSRPQTDAPPRAAGAEPLPGYRLVKRLGGGGYGEVWRCVAPGGLPKAIKFVCGETDPDRPAGALAQELGAIERVKVIRHPYLLGLDRVEVCGPDLLMVMELADKTLQDRLAECAAAGLAGIPRDELLPLLAEAAEALDLLAGHGLQHLDVKPANLFLVGGHLKVGDFGLVGSIGGGRTPAADSLSGITPKYVSPEVLRGSVSLATDQYSLALAAYELLTGRFPYPVQSAQRLVVLHVSAAPDLSAVAPAEAEVLARALAKDPADRFVSCREFARRLADARPPGGAAPTGPVPAADPSPAAADTRRAAPLTVIVPPPGELPAVRAFTEMGRAGDAAPPGQTAEELVRTVIRVSLLGAFDVPGADGEELTDLFCRFPVQAGRPLLQEKLKRFAERWRALSGGVKGGRCELDVLPPAGWLRRLFDQPEPVRLVVTLPSSQQVGRAEVTAVALGCAGRQDARRHALAVELLGDLRAALSDDHEHRRSVRYPVDAPVVLYPVGSGGRVGPGVEARCVDLSSGGARVESAVDPRAVKFYLRFPGHPTAARYGVLCTVVRRAERGPDHFEFGCKFATG